MIIYFHMGTQKTGTTSLQTFMRDHAAELRELGVLYPHAFRGDRAKHNLNALTIISTAQAGASDLKRLADNSRDLVNEIEGGAYRAVFLSNENLWPPRGLGGSIFQQLCDTLSTQFECALVPVVCLRRQDEAMRTRRQMQIRRNHCSDSADQFVEHGLIKDQYNYRKGIESLLQYFSKVRVIDYDAQLPDLIKSYMALLKVPLGVDTADTPRKNISMTAEMCAALTKLPPTISNVEYRRLAKAIRKEKLGSSSSDAAQHPFDIPLSLKNRIMAHHENTNQWLVNEGYLDAASPFFAPARATGQTIDTADPVIVEKMIQRMKGA